MEERPLRKFEVTTSDGDRYYIEAFSMQMTEDEAVMFYDRGDELTHIVKSFDRIAEVSNA